MTFRIPAYADEQPCPVCQSANHDRAISVWSTADERGYHVECDGCGHAWGFRPPVARPDSLPLVRFRGHGDSRKPDDHL